MSLIEIVQFEKGVADANAIPSLTPGSGGGSQTPEDIVLGTDVQDTTVSQITAEWKGTTRRMPAVQVEGGAAIKSRCHYSMNRSLFGSNGPATERVVEYALSVFPSSLVTPQFRRKTESEILAFDGIFVKEAETDTEMAYGWALQEQDHPDVPNDKVVGFLITRGWKTMERFEKSLQTRAYKEAIPILLAWKAPFKMWHVQKQDP